MMKPDFFHAPPATSALRVVHLDLKGVTPAFDRLLELITLFHRMRFTALLIEWEDVFPWTCEPALRAPHAYNPGEILKLAAHCQELGLEIIPLVQSLGHSENVLRLDRFRSLREMPERTDVFHPLHPEAPVLLSRMVEDVLALLPHLNYFHLGADEVYTLGTHPASRKFLKEKGIAALYLQQLNPTLTLLQQREIRPILWHDEIVSWNPDQIRAFADRVDLMVWGYTGDPRDPSTYHHRLPHLEKLASLGCTLWGATSFKGADGPWADLPNIPARSKATKAWAELTPEFNLRGIVCTGWSRYASGRIQVSPIEGALDSLLFAAVTLYTGTPPESVDLCRSWIGAQPEGRSFGRDLETLGRFSEHVAKCWDWIRQLEEQNAHLEFEPHRADSGIEGMILGLLQAEIEYANQAGLEMEELLQGRVASPLLRYYRQSRIHPLRQSFERLQQYPSLSPSLPHPSSTALT